MDRNDDLPQEDFDRLDELIERMMKAGFIKEHAQTKQHSAVVFTPEGYRFVEAIKELESAIGPLTGRDRLSLWAFFRLVDRPPSSR